MPKPFRRHPAERKGSVFDIPSPLRPETRRELYRLKPYQLNRKLSQEEAEELDAIGPAELKRRADRALASPAEKAAREAVQKLFE